MQASIRSSIASGTNNVISVKRLFSSATVHASFIREEAKQIKVFDAGSVIYRRGSAARNVYVLLEGSAILEDRAYDEVTVRPVVICGLIDVLSGFGFRKELRAITPCICSIIGRRDLIRFLKKEPSVSLKLTRIIGRDYQLLTQAFRCL